MNMFNQPDSPWNAPAMSEEFRPDRAPDRTQGYSEREVGENGETTFPDGESQGAVKIVGFVPKPLQAEEVPAEPVEVEKSPVENFLHNEFKYIQETITAHLARNSDKAKLDAALAEVEFYKKLVADAKVAWTQTVPHQEFNWDGLINLGTILSRTPAKE